MRSVLAGFPPLLLAALVAVLGALALAGCGESEPTLASTPEQYHRAFLEVMVPHHVSAVETASLAAENAEIPGLRELAAQIVEIQEAEIAQMEAIHRRLFGEPLEPDPDAHEALGLTAAEAGVGWATWTRPPSCRWPIPSTSPSSITWCPTTEGRSS